jgi:hypothetical protein
LQVIESIDDATHADIENATGRTRRPAGHARSLATSVVVVLGQLFVVVRVEQLIEFRAIAWLDQENPAFAERILVDGFGLVVEQFVDGDDLAGNRRLDVRGGLHRLHHRGAGARLHGRADFRQLDVYQVAELGLRMVGDAHPDQAVVFDAGPLVGLEEFQIARNLAHDQGPVIDRVRYRRRF